VRTVAEKLAESSRALEALPPTHRPAAIDLAEKLRNISDSLASAAELGAKTAHRLQGIANAHAAAIDDASPGESMMVLKEVAALTNVANEASKIGVNLLAANKEAVKELGAPVEDAKGRTLDDFYAS
jgi:hypothetical protein